MVLYTLIFLVGVLFIDTVLGNECYQIDQFREHINMRSQDTASVVTNNENVCSTWGNLNFKTFDGYFYNGYGNCTYIFAQHCHVLSEDFKILIRRNLIGNEPHIAYIFMKLFFQIVEASTSGIYVNGKKVELPYRNSNLNIEYSGIELVLLINGIRIQWNQNDGLQLQLPDKYKNQTCGLCGDFNGFKLYNEGFKDGDQQSIDDFLTENVAGTPGEICMQNINNTLPTCQNVNETCKIILGSPELADCAAHFDMTPYLNICEQDSCACTESDSQNIFCICTTVSEFSKQCAIADGKPDNWRNTNICGIKCPTTMEYKECGTACEKTCSNQEVGACTRKCVTGCFCQNGTVYDDVTDRGCILPSECYCKYAGNIYPTGASLTLPCENCSCSNGMWDCVRTPCPGSCSVEGGSHITTFDQRSYNFHGECSYILAQLCTTSLFSIHGAITSCNQNEFETCLTKVMLIIRDLDINLVIRSNGEVSLNSEDINLPYGEGNLTVFEPTSFYIIVQTSIGLQLNIQLKPIMQVYISISSSYFGLTCGLCGSFNDKQSDDYITPNGMSVQDLSTFTQSWRSDQTCIKVPTDIIDPCSINIQKESYASLWCSKLNSRNEVFSACHSLVNPSLYYQKCLYDTCLCKRAEDCLCAVFSSYVRACTERGIILKDWRVNLCDKYIRDCPASMIYQDQVNTCQPSCKSLSVADASCNVDFTPIDGCICKPGMYLTQYGECVTQSNCQCYHMGIYYSPGEKVHRNGIDCVCRNGKLQCDYKDLQTTNCTPPMIFFNCSLEPLGSTGIECLKSCQSLNVDCYPNECVSGCVCTENMLADGKGGCVSRDMCTCTYNDKIYDHMDKAKIGCDMCTCNNRKWVCDNKGAMAECAVYGEGNYMTFDKRHYRYSGQCEYTLVQDFCGVNVENGTFRIISENSQCSDTGLTCSKTIKVFLDDYILLLTDGDMKLSNEGQVLDSPFQVQNTSLYLIIKSRNGLVLIWNKKSSLTIKITENFQHNVCGLCGNYDGNSINDFNTRGQCTVEDVVEFGNSWKLSSTCPEVESVIEPCEFNPHRKSWSQRQCSIILSDLFKLCHSEVDPNSYYDACVKDSCACDEGGDCDCFCTAVAVYAQACLAHCVCVEWRTPNRCPVFCDYYNEEGKCEWHYKACGPNCMKTCRNPSGNCLPEILKVEGCYPICPNDKPFFEEVSMECVVQCGCYDHMGKYYNLGEKVISCNNCEICECTTEGITCTYNRDACYCEYNGKIYAYNEIIYSNNIGNGTCLIGTCGQNGTIIQDVYPCGTETPMTTESISTVSTRKGSTSSTTPPLTTTICVCNIAGKTYAPGLIYITDPDVKGCQYAIICDILCNIKTEPLPCTTQFTRTTKTPTTTTRLTRTATSTIRTVTPLTSTVTTRKVTPSTTRTTTASTITPYTTTRTTATSTVTQTTTTKTPSTTTRTATTSTVTPSTTTVTTRPVTPSTTIVTTRTLTSSTTRTTPTSTRTPSTTSRSTTTSTRTPTISTVTPSTMTVTTRTVTPYSTRTSTTGTVTPITRTVTTRTVTPYSTRTTTKGTLTPATATLTPSTTTVTTKTVTPFSTRTTTTGTVTPTTSTVTTRTVTPYSTKSTTRGTVTPTTSTLTPSTTTVTTKTVTPFSTRTTTTGTVTPITRTVTTRTVTPYSTRTTTKGTVTPATSTVTPSTTTVTTKTVTPSSARTITTGTVTPITRTVTTRTVTPSSTRTTTKGTVTPATSTVTPSTTTVTTRTVTPSSTRTTTTGTVTPITRTVTTRTVTPYSTRTTTKGTVTPATSTVTPSTTTVTTRTVTPSSTRTTTTGTVTSITRTVTTRTVTPYSTRTTTKGTVTPATSTVTPSTTTVTTRTVTPSSTRTATTSTVKPTTTTVTTRTVTPYSTRTATTSTVKPTTTTVTTRTVTPYSTRTATTRTVTPTTATVTTRTLTPFTTRTTTTRTVTPSTATRTTTTGTVTKATSTVTPTTATVTTRTVTPSTTATSAKTPSTRTATTRTVTTSTISVTPSTSTVTTRTVKPFITGTTGTSTITPSTTTRTATTSTVTPSTTKVTIRTVTPSTTRTTTTSTLTPTTTIVKKTSATTGSSTSTVTPISTTVTSTTPAIASSPATTISSTLVSTKVTSPTSIRFTTSVSVTTKPVTTKSTSSTLTATSVSTRSSTKRTTFYSTKTSRRPASTEPPIRDLTATSAITVSPCTALHCPADSMLNITELDCKIQPTVATCSSPLARSFDEKSCCFTFFCPFCLSSSGTNHLPGETWEDTCQECTCTETFSVICQPLTCPELIPATCTMPGYEPVNVTTPADPCCPVSECYCKPELCTIPESSCSVGFETVVFMVGCCTNVTCIPKGVCVQDNIEYLPGSLVPSHPASCIECTCTSMIDNTTQLNTVNCVPVTCITTCAQGEEYHHFDELCCGKCVQTSCIIIMPNGKTEVIMEDRTWSPSDDVCTFYGCSRQEYGRLYTNVTKTTCEYNSNNDCGPGQEYQKVSDRCCGQCVHIQCMLTLGVGNVTMLVEGETVSLPNDKCTSYTCVKSAGQLIIIVTKKSCEYQSSLDCVYGMEYQPPSGQCCGHCVQTFCSFVTPSGEIKLMREGDIWSSDKCTSYTCEKIKGQLFTLSTKNTCIYASDNDCGLGQTFQITDDQCCGNCVQKSCVITMANGDVKILQDGKSLMDTKDVCTTYTCEQTNGQISTIVMKETCEYHSSQDCQVGEEYNNSSGQCCGQCVQTSCVITAPSGENKTLEAGESWSPEGQECISYGCTQSNEQFFSVLINKTCEAVKPEDCESGNIEISPDGCCSLCKAPRNCGLQFNTVLLQQEDCTLLQNVSYCAGVCMNTPMTTAPPVSSAMTNECKCCEQQSTRKENAQLECTNGTSILYQYDYIVSCDCSTIKCAVA